MKDEVVLCRARFRSYTFDPFIYLEERSSTSVYSDSSPHFGGVQSFCSSRERKDIFGRRDMVRSFRFHPTLIVLFLKQIEFYYKF